MIAEKPDYRSILFGMEDDIHHIRDFAALVNGFLAFKHDPTEREREGINRAVWQIADHAEMLIEAFRLAFPGGKIT